MERRRIWRGGGDGKEMETECDCEVSGYSGCRVSVSHPDPRLSSPCVEPFYSI